MFCLALAVSVSLSLSLSLSLSISPYILDAADRGGFLSWSVSLYFNMNPSSRLDTKLVFFTNTMLTDRQTIELRTCWFLQRSKVFFCFVCFPLIFTGFLWLSYGCPMIVLLLFYGFPVIFLGAPMHFLSVSNRLPMVSYWFLSFSF